MKFYSKHQTFFSKYAILKMMKKGEKMNFLVVLKDTLIERSTFLYVQLQENKTLLHFSPEFHLEGLTLGEIYQAEGLSAVLHFLR